MEIAELRSRRDDLVARDALRGSSFGRAYAEVVEEWLRSLLGDEPGVALVAGGALGRRELAPGSDLDLVLLHDRRKDAADFASRVWYPIWDAKLALDHSVRTAREAIAVADEDLKVVLSLLDGRVVAGDASIAAPVLEQVRERWVDQGRRRLGGLEEITAQRHRKEGDLASLLEPDLKQSRGGLRDLTVLRALDLASPVWSTAEAGLEDARETLLEVRVELHRASGRASDRLVLARQDDVASRLGLRDADVLMRRLADAGRAVAWAGDEAWARTRSWIAGPKGRSGGGDRSLGPGIVLRDREVDVTADADLADDSLVLRAAAAAARLDVPFRTGAVDRLTEAARPGDRWSETARSALVDLLGAGPGLVPTFEALDHRGLVVALWPEWDAVRSKPQRNAFHRFTVDRHLVEAAVQASRLVDRVERPDLLLVGAWLHDLGKGYPGDHTDRGVELMREIGPRLGFSHDDVEVLVTLVREHLLLASVATSRDLDDPATIETVARAVHDRTTFDVLLALTEADSIATGESAWSSWKASLLGVLAARVRERFAGVVPGGAPSGPRVEPAVAGEEISVVGQADEMVVVAPDVPGLLATVVGLLALHGQDVRAAEASLGEDGRAVERFALLPQFDREPDWDRFRAELVDALAGRLPLAERLLERADRYRPTKPAAAWIPETRVRVLRGASSHATVLEVRAADEAGLLSRIAGTIAAIGLDIAQARAITMGPEAVDTFYVRDAATGAQVDDRAEEITAWLSAALAPAPAAG